mmetsp:Transcript_80445/g.167576  ORF Transcript_80445/g.167576 Transcript_80445/m.167576 type:complete len:229 (-) Transcript_80445:863-1549(-)
MASINSKKPLLTEALSSMAPTWISGKRSACLVLSISASAREEPSCSPISPALSFLKSQGRQCCSEYSGSTCSKTPKAFAASRTTSATGSVREAWSMGITVLRKGLMLSTSWTSMAVDPKIWADHFLLVASRSLRPRTTTGMSREREAGSMRDKKVWLPILASTAWVCFWLVGSARAVTNSWESFLISGLATMAPISRRMEPVAFRISARTSNAHSASLGTIRGRTRPS